MNTIQIQSIITGEVSVKEAKGMIIMHKGEAYTFFDEGSSRHVFVNNDSTKIIKILKNPNGFDFNYEEARIYESATDKSQMANTRLFHGIIEQDYCTPIKFGGRKLTQEQREFAGSCRNEVGWASDGNLVCFDSDEYKKY